METSILTTEIKIWMKIKISYAFCWILHTKYISNTKTVCFTKNNSARLKSFSKSVFLRNSLQELSPLNSNKTELITFIVASEIRSLWITNYVGGYCQRKQKALTERKKNQEREQVLECQINPIYRQNNF